MSKDIIGKSVLGVFLFNLLFTVAVVLFGTHCVNYTFLHTLHHTIPVFWTFVLTLVTGGVTPIVAALVVKILILLHIIAG